MQEDVEEIATFFERAAMDLCGLGGPAGASILDFGCGRGRLVQAFARREFAAYGCDIAAAASGDLPDPKLSTIELDPYRLPFDDDSFDLVVSTSVLEHALNKAECFREIRRVLKPGGYSMHLYPGKWYLPYEPHIYVPLVNFFWPHCPKWWLGLWALLGVRNEFQQGLGWRAVVDANHVYGKQGLSYWTTEQYRKLSEDVFGNGHWPMQFYLQHAPGAFARLFKKLPFKAVSGVLGRESRVSFLIQQKAA